MSITAEDLIKHLAAKAATVVAGAAADVADTVTAGGLAPAGATLLKPEDVDLVWQEQLAERSAALNASMTDKSVQAAAGELTKTQVGPLNFENWQKAGGAKRVQVLGSADLVPDPPRDSNPADVKPPVMPDVAGEYLAEAKAIATRVETLDTKLRRLDTGHGAAGAMTRVGVGLAGAEASAIGAVDTAKTAAGAPGKYIGGALTGSASDPGKEVVEKAKALRNEVGTTVEIASGQAQAIFDKTRAPYKKYQEASERFYSHRHDYLGIGGDEFAAGYTEAMKGMSDAVDAMKEAEAEFEASVSGIDVDEQLKRINEWGTQTSSGAGSTIMQMGAEAMGGELAAGEEGAAGEAEEQAAKGAGKRMTEEEADEAVREGEQAIKPDLRKIAAKKVEDLPRETLKDATKDYGKEKAKQAVKQTTGVDLDKKAE